MQIIKAFSFALLLLVCSTDAFAQESSTTEIRNKTAQIDELLERYVELGRFSGAVLIEVADRIVYEKSYGYADHESKEAFSDQTAFKIGTLTRLFVDHMMAELIQEKKLNLQDKVSDYLTEIKGDYSLYDLFAHKSGLPDIATVQEQHPDLAYNPIDFANAEVDTKPQKQYDSDLEYLLLGLLLEQVQGQNFEQLVQQVCSDLGLENTFYKSEESKALAAGHVYQNRGEGLHWYKSPDWDETMAFSNHGLKASIKDVYQLLSHLHNKHLESDGYLEKDGFSYAVEINKDQRLIVLSNNRHPVADEIIASLKAILANDAYEIPLLRKPVEIDPNLLPNYAGEYAINAKHSVKIVAENDSLFALLGPRRAYLTPQSDSQFFMPGADAEIRFLVDEEGKAKGALVFDGFITGREVERVD